MWNHESTHFSHGGMPRPTCVEGEAESMCEAQMLCVLIGIDQAKVRGTMQRSYFSLIQLFLLPSSDIMS